MSNTIHLFMEDDALKLVDKLANARASYPIDQGYGILVGEERNYFVDKGVLIDKRSRRLEIIDSTSAYGSMLLHFDKKQPHAGLEDLKPAHRTSLFNIIERIVYAQEFSDDNIEHQLVNSGLTYEGYVEHSYAHSVNEGEINILTKTNNVKRTTCKDWCSFDFEVPNVKFKIVVWISNHGFKRNYPITTITGVVAPAEPKVLIDTAKLLNTGSIDILLNGSTHVFTTIDEELRTRDQSGAYAYNTKYVLASNRHIRLSFAVTYCGAKVPTTIACRKAIREYLEKATGLNESGLRPIFPELYVDSIFYLIPLWDVFQQFTDREVYPSIHRVNTIIEKAKIFLDYEGMNIEVLTNSYNKMLTVAIADELNKKEMMSVLDQHRTYQDYSSQSAGYRFMTKETQEFSNLLSRVMSVLQGESTSDEFIRIDRDGMIYLSFTNGKSEYLVLTEKSYLDKVEADSFKNNR